MSIAPPESTGIDFSTFLVVFILILVAFLILGTLLKLIHRKIFSDRVMFAGNQIGAVRLNAANENRFYFRTNQTMPDGSRAVYNPPPYYKIRLQEDKPCVQV